ncbi:hypothetical protein P7K49_026174, partial [Saguinus oedipus]
YHALREAAEKGGRGRSERRLESHLHPDFLHISRGDRPISTLRPTCRVRMKAPKRSLATTGVFLL